MKRYTYSNSKWVLLGMIVPILMFFLAMNSVYAYFTATATPQQSSVTTATVKLVFNGDPTASVSGVSTTSQDVLPGQSVTLQGTIVNQGSSDIFALVKCETMINNAVVGKAKYYTPTGKLVYDEATTTYSTYAESEVKMAGLVKNSNGDETYTSSNFTITYTFGFDDYNNTYQGDKVKFVFKALGIQTAHIDYVEAVEYLVEQMG